MDAEGIYDTRTVYEAGMERGAEVVVVPRENAVSWEADHPRTQALNHIAEQGLEDRKEATGYPRRNLAENAFYRFKQIFGRPPGLADIRKAGGWGSCSGRRHEHPRHAGFGTSRGYCALKKMGEGE